MIPWRHRLRVVLRQQTAAHQALQQSATHLRLDRGDGRPVERGGRMEDHASGGRGREHAVDHDTVKVQVGIERGAEAVNERDRAESGRGAGTRAVPPRALLHRA